MSRVFKQMAPWIATIAVVFVVVGLLGATGLFESRAGQIVGAAFVMAIVTGGILFTAFRAGRTPSISILELDARELRLEDSAARVIAAASRSALSVTRGMCRMEMGRSGDAIVVDYPVLCIEMPGRTPFAVGAFDTRFSWSDTAHWLPAPENVVSAPDWYVLLDALDLRSLLVVRD